MEQQPMNNESSPPQPPEGPQPPQGKPGKSRKKKIILGMVIALVALLIIAGAIGGIYAWRFSKAAGDLIVEDVDVSAVADGTYSGSYKLFHVQAAVEVTVDDGRITSITFTDTGKIAEETQQDIEAIFAEVISAQSLDVDITSGASVSKKVSLKAVEEALSGGE
jgi:uncharacterized protein with FMN-binding domain